MIQRWNNPNMGRVCIGERLTMCMQSALWGLHGSRPVFEQFFDNWFVGHRAQVAQFAIILGDFSKNPPQDFAGSRFR